MPKDSKISKGNFASFNSVAHKRAKQKLNTRKIAIFYVSDTKQNSQQ